MNNLLALSDLTSNDVSWLVTESIRRIGPLVLHNASVTDTKQLQVVMVGWNAGNLAPSLAHAEYDTHIEQSFAKATEELGGTFFSVRPHMNERLDDTLDSVVEFCRTSPKCSNYIVIRHLQAGVAHQVANLRIVRESSCAIINAGDGNNENPTEALAIMADLQAYYSHLHGLPAVFLGDAGTDPVARSLFFGLYKLGADIHIFAPSVLAPCALFDVPRVTLHNKPFKAATEAAFFLSPVRSTLFAGAALPSLAEYLHFFAFDRLLPLADVPHRFVVQIPNTQAVEAFLPISSINEISDRIGQPSARHSIAARSAAIAWCESTK